MATNVYGKILKGINDFAGSLDIGDIKIGDSILESNKAINKVGKFIMGEADTGIRGTLKGLSENKKIGAAIKGAYTNGDNINWGAVAGTYVGAATAGRVLTGGGLYRDNTGRANLPVVPFI